MNKQEFYRELEERGNKHKFTDEEYAVVELVYTFHPAISETEGKKQIADIVCKYGMSVIYDMKPRAEKAAELNSQLREARHRVSEIEQELRDLAFKA